MDFKTKLSCTPSGHNSIWVIVDPLTKLACFLPIREDFKVEKLARIYTDEIICRHGTPRDIIYDRDVNLSTALHPQTAGQTERMIRTLEDMLRSCVIDFGVNWDAHIPLVEFLYNNSYH